MGAAAGGIASGIGSIAGGLFGKKSADASNDANLEAAMINKGPWSGAEEYIKGILQDAQGIYGDQGFAPDPNVLELLGRWNSLGYSEGTLPGLIANSQGSWLGGMNYAGQQIPGTVNSLQNSLQAGLNPSMSPWADRMVQATNKDLTQQFAREVLPRISDEAISLGGLGGGRQGVAQGLAAEGLMEAMSDANTQIRGQAYRDMLGHQQSAWANAGNLANNLMGYQQGAWGNMGNMLNAGFLPSDAQRRIGGQYRQDMMLPGQNLQGYMGFVSPFAGMGGGTYQPQNPFASIAGGAMLGGGFGSSIYDWFKGGSSSNQAPDWNNSNINPFDYH